MGQGGVTGMGHLQETENCEQRKGFLKEHVTVA